MARFATVEPGDGAEIHIPRQLRQPAIRILQRAVEGIENWQRQQVLAGVQRAVVRRLAQLIDRVFMFLQGFGGLVFVRGDQLFDALELLAAVRWRAA